jgi:hypothetical protein
MSTYYYPFLSLPTSLFPTLPPSHKHIFTAVANYSETIAHYALIHHRTPPFTQHPYVLKYYVLLILPGGAALAWCLELLLLVAWSYSCSLPGAALARCLELLLPVAWSCSCPLLGAALARCLELRSASNRTPNSGYFIRSYTNTC